MSAEPLLSVVIPSYNYAGVLPRAVGSVLSQATPEVELWVVDDGSSDDTPAVFASLSQRHGAAFQGVRQDNAGPSAARNKGVQLARGRHVLLLDADDELAPGVLPGLCERLRAQPDVDLWLAGHVAVPFPPMFCRACGATCWTNASPSATAPACAAASCCSSGRTPSICGTARTSRCSPTA